VGSEMVGRPWAVYSEGQFMEYSEAGCVTRDA